MNNQLIYYINSGGNSAQLDKRWGFGDGSSHSTLSSLLACSLASASLSALSGKCASCNKLCFFQHSHRIGEWKCVQVWLHDQQTIVDRFNSISNLNFLKSLSFFCHSLEDEASSKIKPVTVTPAVYLSLIEVLPIKFQSSGTVSHRVWTVGCHASSWRDTTVRTIVGWEVCWSCSLCVEHIQLHVAGTQVISAAHPFLFITVEMEKENVKLNEQTDVQNFFVIFVFYCFKKSVDVSRSSRRTNWVGWGLRLYRSQCGGCSTKYDTPSLKSSGLWAIPRLMLHKVFEIRWWRQNPVCRECQIGWPVHRCCRMRSDSSNQSGCAQRRAPLMLVVPGPDKIICSPLDYLGVQTNQAGLIVSQITFMW